MKNLIKISLMLAFFAAIFTGCEKDDVSSPDMKTIILSKTWTFDKVTTNSNNVDIQALVAIAGGFLNGSTIKFDANGTYSWVVLNSPSAGTWELVDKTLTLDKGTEDESVSTVVSISTAQFVFSSNETDPEAFTAVYTWK